MSGAVIEKPAAAEDVQNGLRNMYEAYEPLQTAGSDSVGARRTVGHPRDPSPPSSLPGTGILLHTWSCDEGILDTHLMRGSGPEVPELSEANKGNAGKDHEEKATPHR